MEGWSIPHVIRFHPLSSAAIIAHWRVLTAVLNELPEEDQRYFFALDRKEVLTSSPDNREAEALAGPANQVAPPELEPPSSGGQGGLISGLVAEAGQVACRQSDPVASDIVRPESGTVASGVAHLGSVPVASGVVRRQPDIGVAGPPVFKVEHASSSPAALEVVRRKSGSIIIAAGPTRTISSRTIETPRRAPEPSSWRSGAPPRAIEVVDSHFHLSTALWKLGINGREQDVGALINAQVGVVPRVPVNVVGGVAVYCNPRTFPISFNLGRGFGAAVGVHPRNAAQFDQDTFNHVRCCLRLENVVALGEIGLDHTEPEHTWHRQVRVFTQLLSLAPSGLPIILHIREGELPVGIYQQALDIMRDNVARTQYMHFHCFTGTVETVASWRGAFPNCYFGFTGLARSFAPDQRAAVRMIPEDRILLETDSPYLRTSWGARVNTPAFIGEVADVIAEIRNVSVEHICHTTSDNARRLYRLR